MVIHGRRDILCACGLLLSVDCAQNVLQTSTLLLAGLALTLFFFFNLGCPVCLLRHPRVPFNTPFLSIREPFGVSFDRLHPVIFFLL